MNPLNQPVFVLLRVPGENSGRFPSEVCTSGSVTFRESEAPSFPVPPPGYPPGFLRQFPPEHRSEETK